VGFGVLNGVEVPLLRITSTRGQEARLCAYGARLVGLDTPDRNGRMGDIVLGHDGLDGYLTHPTYFGATCGRYANRIAGGRFSLDGRAVQLDCNEGANHLHGGVRGFDTLLWDVVAVAADRVRFAARSPDGDMGYPGALAMTVDYAWDEAGRFNIVMAATTDAPTVVNMVNHAYFNLSGGGDVRDHVLTVAADRYVPVSADLLPLGDLRPVAGTGFDFRTPVSLRATGVEEGFDHNWCLTGASPAVRLYDPASGRGFDLATNQPGVQIYTCGMMTTPVPAKRGQVYGRFSGLTLETQKFPDSPNHADFPSARLEPGQVYRHEMAFSFFSR
jgi:aldose 1-epimerase